ncbi:arylsulfatase A-like enzyme [Stackebrandtia endophytica]|uniref:Arylsulfatase A-like enzyme n=1 Tax=Stackebrandtia endophytica TaxID=1496996 RepID=A0A543AX49_9ACTN|nr:arylsulfatase [Stackebrandtia endophytica]TQL77139.1 arylsulfatase A-like enzyme [Stackebrandtia endophytica]
MTAPQPNIVLITADQWRGDHLSAAGHPVVRTPYLDALANRGTRFDRAYSPSPSCIPARASLHTGLAPRTHGRVGYQDGVDWDFGVTMAGEFGRGGYQTRAIGKMHAAPARNLVGFDEVVLHDGYLHHSRVRQEDPRFTDDYRTWLTRQPGQNIDSDYADHGVDCNSIVARPWPRAEHLHPTNWVVTEAIDFLYRRDPTRPFFLNLSFHRPHPPLDPPQWAFDQFMSAPPYRPTVAEWADTFTRYRQDHRPDAGVAEYDPATLHRARAGYLGNMAHIDQQIQRFVEAMAEFGHTVDNTWFCFTSDHGEMLGEHRLWRKSLPYEGSARIPFILTGPGTRAAVSDELVDLADVMPTLLDCAGLDLPSGLDGRSLRPIAAGEPVAVDRDHLHIEHGYQGGQSVHAILDRDHKYVWFSGDGHQQLFDMVDDRAELTDLAPDNPKLVARYRSALVDRLTDSPEGYVHDGDLVTGRTPLNVLPLSGLAPPDSID